MVRYKKGRDARLPVIFKSVAGSAVAGVAYSQLVIDIITADGVVTSSITPASSAWTEFTGTAYGGQGYYNYVLTGSYLGVTGVFQYCFVATGTVPYFGVVEVVDAFEQDVMNILGPSTYGTITADIANVGVTAGSGGFTAQDRAMLSATYHTASLLPADPASNTAVLSYVTQSFWTTDRLNLNAIKAKTDNLPTDPASNAQINGAATGVNTNTNSQISSLGTSLSGQLVGMKGGAWNSNATLNNIYSYAVTVATQAYLSQVFGTITGAGFASGTDDLHGLSLQLQGITPGSGGGGFSAADRSALYACYSSTLPLPADPASNTYILDTRHRIMGIYPYGAPTGSTTASFTIYAVSTGVNSANSTIGSIWSHAQYIPTNPATTADVNNARDYLAGAGYVQATNSLVAITNLITGSNFTNADRTMITNISNSVGFGLSGTVNNVNANLTVVKGKTDLLPNDVVSSGAIFPLLYQISGGLAASGGFSDADRTNILAIKTSTDRLPAQPADQAITFNATDRTNLNQIYSKTSPLPIDPASITYITQVSQSLGAQMSSMQAALSGNVSASNTTLSGAIHSISATLGNPGYGTVVGDIAQAIAQGTNAGGYAQSAYIGTQNIASLIGAPMSGSVSTDISATYHAVLTSTSSITGVISASVDLSPVLNVLGQPVQSIARDMREVGKLVQAVSGALYPKR